LAGLGAFIGCSVRNRFDLMIRNGLVLDGLGTPARRLDIGIRDGKILALGDLSGIEADQIIDVAGMIISPGFIDIHSHTDIELLVNPRAESKIHQGVTTEISGNCGDSPFPLTLEDQDEYFEKVKEKYGLDLRWHDLSGFYRALKHANPAMNYATYTGHGSLRAFVVGKNDVPPSPDQLQIMQKVLIKSMEQGSLGLSTGLEYAPGSYAKTDELIELCKVVAGKNGVYATHMRNEDDTIEAAVAESLKICQSAQVSLQISHFKTCNQANWHKMDRLLDTVHSAAESGLPVQIDRYPYIAWSTGLTQFLPLWARQGNTREVLARLQDKSQLPKIREYSESRAKRIGSWDRVVIADCFTPENKKWEGRSIQSCAQENCLPAFDFIHDLLIAEENRVGVIGFAMDEDNLKKVLASSICSIGSDGNAVAPTGKLGEGKPHPRFYGTFPRVLGKYCRDEKVASLPEIVQRMTSMPAKKVGLKRRGSIQTGNFADLVVFDPITVIDNASFENPHQFPTGILHVIVNGKIAVRDAKHTGICAGDIL
ncbi:MAG: D-aminoacylase, partial [Candidatus Marinimicrobia bacterium]|nr:D-aminoacylase [Candidatus Neomarinimicrobiota bacterium]